MALDGIVILVIGPVGLIVYAMGLGMMMLSWRGILGSRFAVVGFWPLLAGLAASSVMTLASCAVQSSFMYAERLAAYPELGGFWHIVPGWTLYLYAIWAAMLFFVFVIMLVPFAALLVRRDRLTWKAIALILLAGWLLASAALGAFPQNEWQEAHRLEHLWGTALRLSAPFWLILGPYFAAILATMRRWPMTPRQHTQAT